MYITLCVPPGAHSSYVLQTTITYYTIHYKNKYYIITFFPFLLFKIINGEHLQNTIFLHKI